MPDIYQMKVTLVGSKPPIWRRIQVPASIKLSELHWILQKVMGWTDSHMHAFAVGARSYGEPDPELEMADEGRVALNKVVKGEKARFRYEYDFGDGREGASGRSRRALPPLRDRQAALSARRLRRDLGLCSPRGGPPRPPASRSRRHERVVRRQPRSRGVRPGRYQPRVGAGVMEGPGPSRRRAAAIPAADDVHRSPAGWGRQRSSARGLPLFSTIDRGRAVASRYVASSGMPM